MEAKSDKIPKTISSVFSGGVIKLNGTTLLPHHISSLIFYMSSSTQQWRYLNLRNCNLRSSGMNMLLRRCQLWNMSTSVEMTHLHGECIVRQCCVNSLTLCGDNGMEEHVKDITDSLEANTTLQCLKLCHINYKGIDCIAKIIHSNTTLRKLDLSQNNISDNGAVTVINHLKNIQELYMSHNNITSKGMNRLMLSLINMHLPEGHKSVENVSTLEYVDLSRNHSSPWGVYCVIIRH